MGDRISMQHTVTITQAISRTGCVYPNPTTTAGWFSQFHSFAGTAVCLGICCSAHIMIGSYLITLLSR